jgi:hypothetical protein
VKLARVLTGNIVCDINTYYNMLLTFCINFFKIWKIEFKMVTQ